jgi:hypothetical protein
MRYFCIKNNRDPKVTGIKSGTSPACISASLFKDKIWLNEFLYGENSGLRAGEFPSVDFKLEKIPLDNTAVLTDFICVGVINGFVISEKVKSILKLCNLPPHKYYPVTFEQKEVELKGYYWFYYNLFDGSSYINYERTIFNTKEEEKILDRKIIIDDFEDYYSLSIKMKRGVHVQKIIFDKSFNKNIDFFGMRFFGGDNYISEKLKEYFEENKVTGYMLRYPLTDPEVEWE